MQILYSLEFLKALLPPLDKPQQLEARRKLCSIDHLTWLLPYYVATVVDYLKYNGQYD